MVYIHGIVFVKLTTIYSEYRAIKSITNASVLILKQCLGLHYKISFDHKILNVLGYKTVIYLPDCALITVQLLSK